MAEGRAEHKSGGSRRSGPSGWTGGGRVRSPSARAEVRQLLPTLATKLFPAGPGGRIELRELAQRAQDEARYGLGDFAALARETRREAFPVERIVGGAVQEESQ